MDLVMLGRTVRIRSTAQLLVFLCAFLVTPTRSSLAASSTLSSTTSRWASSPMKFSTKNKAFERIPFLVTLRGGSAAAATATASQASAAQPESDAQQVRSYQMQQQLHLQSRSLQLRQELIMRGLDALRHGGNSESDSVARTKVVDWDCALSTADRPKSCLYSFDAEEGAKVIAPIDTTQWITLTSLNRLRRSDPTKIEPLWHSQYSILSSWFAPESQYSLYSHLSPMGTALSLLLDAPWLLAALIGATITLALLLTLPIWEVVVTTLLTSKFLWLQWPNWGRFVHAALPLKLLLGQMAWKAISVGFQRVYNEIRTVLVEWECRLWQDSIPLTIIEDGSDMLESATSETDSQNDDDEDVDDDE